LDSPAFVFMGVRGGQVPVLLYPLLLCHAPLYTLWRSGKPRCLFETKDEVHVLHGLARGALDEVVNGGNRYHAAFSWVSPEADVALVGGPDCVYIWILSFGQEADKGFTSIGLAVDFEEVLCAHAFF